MKKTATLREAEAEFKQFVSGDKAYTPAEAREAMEAIALEDMDEHGWALEEYIEHQRECMVRAEHEYHIDYFARNGTPYVDDGTWSTPHVFFARPLTEEEAEVALDNYLDDARCSSDHVGGSWRLVDYTTKETLHSKACPPEYVVEVAQTGDELAEFATLEEAEAYVRQQQDEDRENGQYEDGWYLIRNTETNETERY